MRSSSADAEGAGNEPINRDAEPPDTMVAASVLTALPGLSWRERAALKRKQAGEQ